MKKPAAVAYYRTSSAANVGTDKDSERRQREAVAIYAHGAKLEVVAEFYDAAVSGADAVDQRAGLSARRSSPPCPAAPLASPNLSDDRGRSVCLFDPLRVIGDRQEIAPGCRVRLAAPCLPISQRLDFQPVTGGELLTGEPQALT
jgi:hypothetical protein